MDNEITHLASKFAANRNSTRSVSDALNDLYGRYIRQREQTLLDAVAATAAVDALFLEDQIDFSKVTPQMEEAFHLAFPNVDFASLAERNPDEVIGFMSAWKGKFFEVIVRDDLNSGDWVGNIHLEFGQTAVLAESATQPGWDLQILESDGSIANELQLKATDSLSYVKQAIERYPDISVLSTDEVFQKGGDSINELLSSGYNDLDLEKQVKAPMEELLDSPLAELSEDFLPLLPFVIIAVGEGRKVLMGRTSFNIALQSSMYRAIKSGSAIGVGALVVWLDGGLISLPASFLTRLGFDRVQIANRATHNIEKRTYALKQITTS